jgi:hypothetical protein
MGAFFVDKHLFVEFFFPAKALFPLSLAKYPCGDNFPDHLKTQVGRFCPL